MAFIVRGLLMLLSSLPAAAAELHIQFAALQRMLAEQHFTAEGRHYVKGDAKSRCQFAYLENPQLWEDRGRVRVKARFSGKTALGLFGKCVGVGDSFDLTFAGSPYYKDGAIALKDIEVIVFAESFYARRVRSALAESLRTSFKYHVADDAKRLLEQSRPGASFRQELENFTVTGIRVSNQSLILGLDFRLIVK